MHDALTFAAPSAQTVYGPDAKPLPRGHVILGWLTAAPLAPAAIGLAIGVFINAAWAAPFWAAMIAFAAAGVVLVRARQNDGLRHAVIALAAAALGTALHDTAFRRWSADHIVRYSGDEPTLVRMTGTVVQTPFAPSGGSEPIEWIPSATRTRLLVDSERLEGVSGPIDVSGLVTVLVRAPLAGVNAGDRVELFGTLHRPAPPDNPGERDWALVHRRNGVLAEMSCTYAANVKVLAPGRGPARLLGEVRRRACAAMREQAFEADAPGGRLLEALVLGQRSAVSVELNQAFVNTGTVHYLSVSGAHVGVLVGFVWLVGWVLGRTRRQCAAFAVVVVTAYALLTEPSPAITRSAIMSVVFCAAIWWRRPLRAANALAAAALIILVISPTQLFDASFQLSFVSLLAIMYLAERVHAAGKWGFDKLLRRDDPLLQPEIQRMLNPPSWRKRAMDFCLRQLGWALALSVAASLAGAGLCAYHFRQVPLWGWLNTVLVTIPMSLVLLLGLVKTAVSAVFPPGAVALGWPLEQLTAGLIWCIHTLDLLPGSGSAAPQAPAWIAALGLAVLAFWVVAPRLRIRGRWVAGTATGFALLAGWSLWARGDTDVLKVDVLSVGNGTACVIQMPGGRTMLYDMGARPPYDLQRWTVGPFLSHERIRSIDVLAVSHAELDHFSGVPDLLDRVRVRELLTAPHFHRPPQPGSPAERLFADLSGRDLPKRTVTRGDRVKTGGGATIEVLWPPPEGELEIHDANNASLVLRITYAGRRVLLCGDIEEAAERHLMLSGDVSADVLVLPHHGSVVRTTGEFIRAVNPAWCIRSSGRVDRETSNGLLELMAGRQYLNTADRGAVSVRIAEGEMSVRGFRQAP